MSCGDEDKSVAELQNYIAYGNDSWYADGSADCSDGEGTYNEGHSLRISDTGKTTHGTKNDKIVIPEGETQEFQMLSFFENMPESLLEEGCYDDCICFYDDCYHPRAELAEYYTTHGEDLLNGYSYDYKDFDYVDNDNVSFQAWQPVEPEDANFGWLGIVLAVPAAYVGGILAGVGAAVAPFIAERAVNQAKPVIVNESAGAIGKQDIHWDIEMNGDKSAFPDAPCSLAGASFTIQNNIGQEEKLGDEYTPAIRTEASYTYTQGRPAEGYCQCDGCAALSTTKNDSVLAYTSVEYEPQ